MKEYNTPENDHTESTVAQNRMFRVGLYIIIGDRREYDMFATYYCLKFAAKDGFFQLLLLFSQLIFVLLHSDCICLTIVVTVRRVLSR